MIGAMRSWKMRRRICSSAAIVKRINSIPNSKQVVAENLLLKWFTVKRIVMNNTMAATEKAKLMTLSPNSL